MNTMKWLLRRELWENKGGFVWAPAVLGTIMFLGIALTGIVLYAIGSKHGISIDGEQVTNLSRVLTASEKAEVLTGLADGYMASSGLLYAIMAIVVFFYCLGSLFDDRKDKSVLFWKSLPVSDSQTVLSKVAMALAGAPLITLAIGVAVSVAVLVAACAIAAVGGVNFFGVFLKPQTWLAPLELLAMLPVYAIWALPTVGWLMMVSAWARTKPFLWAVGLPVAAGALLSWFEAIFDYGIALDWFWANIVGRGLGSVVPGIWFAFTDVGSQIGNHSNTVGFGELLGASWRVLGTANAWIGAVLGVAMIYAAMRLRRWRDEG